MLDVAQRAGVGKVTVSYVLNGRAEEARISPETAQRVLDAARELDYRPNALARMLLRKRTDTIAVVFQYADYFTSSTSFTSDVMRGVCAGCVDAGVDLMLHTKAASDKIAEANALTDGRVDGALFLRDEHDAVLDLMLERRFPVVLFFSRSHDPTVPFVDLDNIMGGRLATNHLLELGHRRIAMLRGSPGSVSSNDRIAGYQGALESAGVPFDERLVISGNVASDAASLVKLMREDLPPTACFCWSDDDAFGCMRVLNDMGINVPRDVSVVGFDSSAACERVSPPLTSVRQPIAEMARRATQVLVALVQGAEPDITRHCIVFPPTLDIRASTAPVK
jgi:LacI family transcriptional regulator